MYAIRSYYGPEASVMGVTPALFPALDTLDARLRAQSERLTALETLLMNRQLEAAVTPGGWPVNGGWVSSGFGWRADPFTGRRARHEGVDIASRVITSYSIHYTKLYDANWKPPSPPGAGRSTGDG